MRRFIRGCGVAVCALALVVSHHALAEGKINTPPAKYIESLGNQALVIIKDAKIDTAKRQAVLEGLFADNLDFDWVGKFVLGRFWRQATDAQKSRYMAAYKTFLTKHYTSRFAEHADGTFAITNARDIGDGDTLVSMAISSGNDPAVMVDYKVHKTGAGFKVFDIIVEGVSLITSQRSEFASVVNKSGIDGLISQLEVK